MATQVTAQDAAASAVRKLQEYGVAGCGGAGFPTYVKYSRTTPALVVNVQDSEPGYVKDKLILLAYPELMRQAVALLKGTFGFQRVTFGIKGQYREWFSHLEGDLDITYTNNQYWTGEAKRLVSQVLGVQVPTSARTQDFGATVSCIETLLNIYRVLAQGWPVTEKIVQVYGAVKRPRLFRVPVGTYALDLLWRTGLDLQRAGAPLIIAGGPMMGDAVDPGQYAVGKVTSDLFVTDQTFFQQRNAQTPTWGATPTQIAEALDFGHCMHWHPEPSEIEDLTGEIERVGLDLHQTRSYGSPSRPLVEVGRWVARGQLIAAPPQDGWGLGLHASIDGQVEEVNDRQIIIRQRRGFSLCPLPPATYSEEVEGRPVTVARSAPHRAQTQAWLEGEGVLEVSHGELDAALLPILAGLHRGVVQTDREQKKAAPDVAEALTRALDEVAAGRMVPSLALDRFATAAQLEINFREVVGNCTLDILGWDRARFKATYLTHYGYLVEYMTVPRPELWREAGILALYRLRPEPGLAVGGGHRLDGSLGTWITGVESALPAELALLPRAAVERRQGIRAYVYGLLAVARDGVATGVTPLAIYSLLEAAVLLARLREVEHR